MVDQSYLVEVFRPQQKRKLPDAQKNREVATIAEIGADGAPVQSVNGKTGEVVLAAADISGVVDLTSAQSISGVKTFSASPIVPVPSDGTEAANKNYVDAQHTIATQYTDTQVATAVPLSQKGAANGVATLDASGVIPTAQVNVSGLSYLGTWDASTNTPALANGSGTVGDFYKASAAGSVDFGAGAIAFNIGDWVLYEGGIWQQVGSHEAVASVNGKTGVVVLVAADVGALPDSYVPAWADIAGKPVTFPAALLGQVGGPVGPVVNTVEVVYANNDSGQQTTFGYTVAATPGTFPFRDGSGRIQVASGDASSDAANVGQLDARLSAAQRTAIDALTAVATADATDPASTMALANANKAAINSIIDALKAS